MHKNVVEVPNISLESPPYVFADRVAVPDRKVRVDADRDVGAETVAHPPHLARGHAEHSID